MSKITRTLTITNVVFTAVDTTTKAIVEGDVTLIGRYTDEKLKAKINVINAERGKVTVSIDKVETSEQKFEMDLETFVSNAKTI